jgi:hypothetical protein
VPRISSAALTCKVAFSLNRAGNPAHPNHQHHLASHREWATQQDRNQVMDPGEQAHGARFMIRGRGSNFTVAFAAVLADAGILDGALQHPTPRMNAIAERWIGGCP